MTFDLEIEYQGNTESINKVKKILKKYSLIVNDVIDTIWGNQFLVVYMGVDDEYIYDSNEFLHSKLNTKLTLLIGFKPYRHNNRNLRIEGNILMNQIIYDICKLFPNNSCMLHFQYEIIYYKKDIKKSANKYKKFILDDTKPDKYALFDGSERALFLYWAFQKGFLKDEVKQKVNFYSKNILPLTNDKLLEMMKSSIGNIFISDIYLEEYRIFCMVYTMIINGTFYDLNMYTDIGTLYPNLTDFSQLDESTKDYNKLFDMFDSAYDNYVSNIELWQ